MCISIPQEDIVNVAQQLHTCYLKKNYLREFCYISIAHLVDLCHSQGNYDIVQDEVIPIALDTEWDGCTAEQLFLYLHMNNIYGKVRRISLIHVILFSLFFIIIIVNQISAL